MSENEGEYQQGSGVQNDPQDLGDQAASGQQQQGEPTTVPLQVVQSLRQELKDAKARAKQAEEQVNQQGGGQLQPQQQQSGDLLADADDEEFMTVGQARKIIQQTQQETSAALRETQMRQRYVDYDEVIQNHLPQLVREKPYLREAIMSSQDPYSLAYELGKSYKDARDGGAQSPSGSGGQSAEEQLDQYLQQAQQKPGSVSAASSHEPAPGGGDIFSMMSPDELDKEIQAVKRGEKT